MSPLSSISQTLQMTYLTSQLCMISGVRYHGLTAPRFLYQTGTQNHLAYIFDFKIEIPLIIYEKNVIRNEVTAYSVSGGDIMTKNIIAWLLVLIMWGLYAYIGSLIAKLF